MSEPSETLRFFHFRAPAQTTALALPFDLDERIAAWSGLRTSMIRVMPPEFSREEWAYLVTFLDEENLWSPFAQSFGKLCAAGDEPAPYSVLVPRGPVALWLPNNVSLLGPLMLVLASLSGNPLFIKRGSQAADLTGAFLGFALEKLPDGALANYLRQAVVIESFPHDDPRQARMAAEARIRILFGTRQAAAQIDALPHPLDSEGIYFTERHSEAWLEPEAVDDRVLDELIKVFAIYGQAGCTAPKRVVLLGASEREAATICRRLLDRWPTVIRRLPEAHLASENILGRQWAAALGWQAHCTEHNGAVIAYGPPDLTPPSTTRFLPLTWSSQDDACAALPANIQTIGYAFVDPRAERLMRLTASTGLKRLVPLVQMHHFGPVWDGSAFWRRLFEERELRR